jgi:signal transduction histidine kinase
VEVFSAIWAVIYLFFAYFISRRERAYGDVVKYMILYCSLAIFFEALHVIYSFAGAAWGGEGFWTWRRPYSIFILEIVFLWITYAFVNQQNQKKWWMITIAGWALILFVVIIDPSGYIAISIRAWKDMAISGGILLGWFTLIGANGYAIVGAFLNATKPLHKNRIIFWAFAVFVLALGDVLVFSRQDILGSLLRIAGLLMAGYVVFFQDLVDLSGAIQRLPTMVYKIIVAVVLYAAVFFVRLPMGLSTRSEYRPVEFLIKALILVIGVNPLLALINKFVDRSFAESPSTQSGFVRKYNLAIAQIVDLHRLAEVALGEIIQLMRIQSARLYLIDQAEAEGGFYIRHILPSKNETNTFSEAIKFAITGPIVHHFNQLQKPLLQYDIDFAPRFFNIDQAERAWFSEQQMDLYIPICTLDTWIGLFALGPKITGERFYQTDLELLSTLAEQTVIALQNARLVEDLRLTRNMLEEANQKLRSIDESKSAFISVVTHEFRTPLVNIGFSLQVLEMYGKNHLLPEQQELFDQLSRSVQVARKMIDDLISYASFINDQVDLVFAEFDFRKVLLENLASLKIQANEKSLNFNVEVPTTPMPVVADRKLLMEAIQHLVMNAIKFTQTGSIWISCRTQDDILCFDVQDTGIGIPSEKLDEIWNAFNQATSDPLRRGLEGLGLGLALVKMVIESHNGFVWVESIYNSGSFFGFQIPVKGSIAPLDEVKAHRLQQLSLKRSLNWQVRQRSIYEPE